METVKVSSRRTVYGDYVQTCARLGITPTIDQATTLNTKLGVFTSEKLVKPEMPYTRYLAIGNGGHDSSKTSSGKVTVFPVEHYDTTDACLFMWMPWVLRTVDNDLTDLERESYRLRKLMTVNGKQMVGYWLKVLDVSNVVPTMEILTAVPGQDPVTTPFVPSASCLSPKQPVLVTGAVISPGSQAVRASAKLHLRLSSSDIAEFTNVCNLLDGTIGTAIISELALCSGVDRNLVGDFQGMSRQYTEAVGVQVCNFLSPTYVAASANNGIDHVLDIGNTEALLVVKSS